MILLDSGYLIALLVPRDALHERALRWSEAVQEELLLTEYVLWETVNYLSPLADRPKAHLLVDEIDGNPAFAFVYSSPELFQAGIALHRARADKTWIAVDFIRSEEHTSELQSRGHLVCRLLLEKKIN